MLDRLFVYGSLGPGKSNAHVLAHLVGEWRPGSVQGRLVDDGWAATLGYPAIVLDNDAGTVRGLLFTSPDLRPRWDEIDAFEGVGYERRVTTVRLDGGESVEAFVYALRERSRGGAGGER